MTNAEDMPDQCHDHCRDDAVYYPFKWASDGTAHYRCARGHHWTCWWAWAVGQPGRDPDRYGTPAS